MTKLFVYFGLAFALAACSHKQTRFDQTAPAVNAEGEKHVAASLNWLKNKSDAIDLEVRVVNNTDAPVRVYGSESTLEFGGQKVAARRASDLRLPPGVTSHAVMIFTFAKGTKPADGPATLTLVPYAEEKALEPVKLSFNVSKK